MLSRRNAIILPVALLLLIGLTLMLNGTMTSKVHEAGGSTSPLERIGGFEVLDIRTKDNAECHTALQPHLTLRSTDASHSGLLSSDSLDNRDIDRDLRKHGYPEGTTISIAGPDSTRTQVTRQRAKWNQARKANGCIRFGGSHEPDTDLEVSHVGRRIGAWGHHRSGDDGN